MPSRPMPQSVEIISRSAGMCLSAARICAGDLLGLLDLQVWWSITPMEIFLSVMILPMASRSMPPDARRLEGDDVGVDLVVGLERGLVALHLREHALLRRVAPARMRPDLGLGAQPLHGAVEHLDHQLGIDHRVLDVAHRDQMDLRLLDLDHRAAGVGELVVFLVERVGDREHAVRHALVVPVLHRERDDLRRHARRTSPASR